MAKLDPAEVVRICRLAGFGSNQKIATALSICWAESNLHDDAVHINTDGSKDKGIAQINDKWHSEVSEACAFDPLCALREMYRISAQGTAWSPWSTYKNYSYEKHLTAAWLAIRVQDLKEKITQVKVLLVQAQSKLG